MSDNKQIHFDMCLICGIKDNISLSKKWKEYPVSAILDTQYTSNTQNNIQNNHIRLHYNASASFFHPGVSL